jgi:hypothetical protein
MTWLWIWSATVVFFLWAVLGHPTPAEQARARDSIGHSTGQVWAQAHPTETITPLLTAPPSPPPPRAATIRVPSRADLLSGRACLPLTFLLSNRAAPEDFGYARSIACEKEPS